MTRRADESASLFDETFVEVVADKLDDWVEVSQARFLAWSTTMQLHYCWRRDLDSATRSESTADATFFLQRAAAYKALLDEIL